MTRPRGIEAFHAARPWYLISLFLLGFAITNSTFRVARDTYRFLFVIDITQSMNVGDTQTGTDVMTRLGFAKTAIETAFKDLPCGSEAGLAIFAAHRTFVMFTPVEVCEHYRPLSEMLHTIDWRMAWAARSEVAKGLYSAIDAASQSGPDTHLVFLTDGHEAPPINKDIRPPFNAEPGVVAGLIGGIGGLVPSRIPHLDDEDKIIGYWEPDEVLQIDIHSLGRPTTEEREAMVGINMADIARRVALGQEHLSSLREAYLQELAVQTGLNYVRLESATTLTESLRHSKYARRTLVLSDMSWIPATIAFVCLFYCLAILPRRSHTGYADSPTLRLSVLGLSRP